jgi:hypothetical protein
LGHGCSDCFDYNFEYNNGANHEAFIVLTPLRRDYILDLIVNKKTAKDKNKNTKYNVKSVSTSLHTICATCTAGCSLSSFSI